MDSFDVTITTTTSSINGQQSETEIDLFVLGVLRLAGKLSHSSVEVSVMKHQLRVLTSPPTASTGVTPLNIEGRAAEMMSS